MVKRIMSFKYAFDFSDLISDGSNFEDTVYPLLKDKDIDFNVVYCV